MFNGLLMPLQLTTTAASCCSGHQNKTEIENFLSNPEHHLRRTLGAFDQRLLKPKTFIPECRTKQLLANYDHKVASMINMTTKKTILPNIYSWHKDLTLLCSSALRWADRFCSIVKIYTWFVHWPNIHKSSNLQCVHFWTTSLYMI